MVFLVQLKKEPKKLLLIRATSRLDAFNYAKLIDVPTKTWCLEEFNDRAMTKSLQDIELK